jgi:hypothetical protein
MILPFNAATRTMIETRLAAFTRIVEGQYASGLKRAAVALVMVEAATRIGDLTVADVTRVRSTRSQ